MDVGMYGLLVDYGWTTTRLLEGFRGVWMTVNVVLCMLGKLWGCVDCIECVLKLDVGNDGKCSVFNGLC